MKYIYITEEITIEAYAEDARTLQRSISTKLSHLSSGFRVHTIIRDYSKSGLSTYIIVYEGQDTGGEG